MGKKVSLIAFKQVLTKILPAAFIQLHNYDLLEKPRLKLSPFKKQCPAGLYPRIIHQESTFLLEMVENLTQEAKVYSFLPSGKFPLIGLNLSLSTASFLPHQTAIFK